MHCPFFSLQMECFVFAKRKRKFCSCYIIISRRELGIDFILKWKGNQTEKLLNKWVWLKQNIIYLGHPVECSVCYSVFYAECWVVSAKLWITRLPVFWVLMRMLYWKIYRCLWEHTQSFCQTQSLDFNFWPTFLEPIFLWTNIFCFLWPTFF